MEIIKKTHILVKKSKEFAVRQTSSAEQILCRQCGFLILTAQKAADLCAVSTRLIYRLIEAESVHFIETGANEIYVCPVCVKWILGETDNDCHPAKI